MSHLAQGGFLMVVGHQGACGRDIGQRDHSVSVASKLVSDLMFYALVTMIFCNLL